MGEEAFEVVAHDLLLLGGGEVLELGVDVLGGVGEGPRRGGKSEPKTIGSMPTSATTRLTFSSG